MTESSPRKKLTESLGAAKRKAAKVVSRGAGNAAAVGAKAADVVKGGANAVANNLQQRRVEQQYEKYSPVFPDTYSAPNYDRPDLIILRDGDSRKDVSVCDGAIGWFDKINGLEVLNLYKEYVDFSGISFHPLPVCDAAYYVDAFDQDRYINIENYLDVIRQEQISELQDIAYALGAKECYVEVFEEDRASMSTKAKGSIAFSPKAKVASGSASASQDKSSENFRQHSIVHHRKFKGSDTPTEPELNYFKSDRTVLGLIKNRCSDVNGITEDQVRIDTVSSTGINTNRAAKIDAAISGSKLKANGPLETKARNESKRTQIFHIKF